MAKRTTVPVDRYIVVEKVLHSSSSLILEETVTDKDMFDIVAVTVGPDCKRGVKPGDMLLLADGVHAFPACDDRKLHFLISETDVIGVINVTAEK